MTQIPSSEHHQPGGRKRRAARLQAQFNDIYFLFLSCVTQFGLQAATTDRDERKLRSLFEELLRTRALLEGKR